MRPQRIQGLHTVQSKEITPNVIDDDETESITNVFCFGAFADKRDGMVYNDLTGLFPFIFLDRSICFFCHVSLQNKRNTGNPCRKPG